MIRCDACGCAFEPEILTRRDGEFEYTFFRCDYCGKAYMIAVTDEKLRQDIAWYSELCEKHEDAREILKLNQKRGKELKEELYG